jgi:hypothetical protein
MVLALALGDASALAQRRGGGGNRGNVRSSSRNSVHRNNNVNRNNNYNRHTNINRNTNINVNRDVNVYGGGGCCYHSGWGTAAAVATTAIVTAAVVGSMVNTLPPACSMVVVNGFTYQQCGSTWYQPQISGSSTTYIVVNAP